MVFFSFWYKTNKLPALLSTKLTETNFSHRPLATRITHV